MKRKTILYQPLCEKKLFYKKIVNKQKFAVRCICDHLSHLKSVDFLQFKLGKKKSFKILVFLLAQEILND